MGWRRGYFLGNFHTSRDAMNSAYSRFLSLALSTCLWACACTRTAPSRPEGGASVTTDLSPDMVVATLGGRKITLAELDKITSAQLHDLEEQRFQIRRDGLDKYINETLVKEAAGRANLTEETYLKQEVDSKIKLPSEAEVAEFFKHNTGQLPPGAKLEEYRERIVAFLSRQAHSERAKEVFSQLRKDTAVEILLTPPPKPRVQVAAEGPTRGPSEAKVTIVEFSDFECPYCRTGHDTVEKVMQKYEGKVRLTFRHFPLPFHSHARKAAEASLCAEAQGKFWPFHDLLFAEQKNLAVPQLKEHASKVGLDAAKFASCLDSGEQAKAVDVDMKAGEAAGVRGTPAFFINGIMISGAHSAEEFERLIDAELAAS